MPAVETLKKITEKVTGWSRPSHDALAKLVRARKPQSSRFADDGIIPNHQRQYTKGLNTPAVAIVRDHEDVRGALGPSPAGSGHCGNGDRLGLGSGTGGANPIFAPAASKKTDVPGDFLLEV